jgi:hypothetical protein
VERAVIDGIAYERDGSPARLVEMTNGWSCEVWFGDSRYAEVATISARGALLAGPSAIASLSSRVLGESFPRELREAIAELVAECVVAPLADDARAAVAARTLAWADLGARAAISTHDGFAIHAALWERISPHGFARLGLALAEALAPVVSATLVAEWIEARAH